MKLYEIEVETPVGVKSSTYRKSNLRARFEFESQPLGLNTLRLWRVCSPAPVVEALEQWANGVLFNSLAWQRELLATRYPEANKVVKP